MTREDTVAVVKNELQPELMSIMKEEVGKARESRVPIIRAFEEIARRSGLKSNTIRNYYYRYLHVNEEMTQADTKNIGESNQEKDIGRPFTDEETRELMREMLIAQGRGESVRGCANRLGNGNKRMLIRYQNKYRSIIAREPQYVESIIKELEDEGISCFNPYTRSKMSRLSGETMTSSAQVGGGQLIEWVGQFVNNIHNTQVVSLQDFIKGLLDLSSLAVGNQSLGRIMEKHNREVQELSNRVILLESSLKQERDDNQMIKSKLNKLMEINKAYIGLPDEKKLSELNGYLSELRSCMQG